MKNYLALLNSISHGLRLPLQPEPSQSQESSIHSVLKQNVETQITQILQEAITDKATLNLIMSLVIPMIRQTTDRELSLLIGNISKRCELILSESEPEKTTGRSCSGELDAEKQLLLNFS